MERKDMIKTLRESTGMNRKEFCEYFGYVISNDRTMETCEAHSTEGSCGSLSLFIGR